MHSTQGTIGKALQPKPRHTEKPSPARGCVARPIGADLAIIGYNKADLTFDKTGLHSFEEQDTMLKISKVRFLNNSTKVHCSNEIQLFQNTH